MLPILLRRFDLLLKCRRANQHPSVERHHPALLESALAQMIAHNSKVGKEDRKPHAGTVGNPISVDELAALDAVNKRLKRLLAEQLRA